MLTEIKRTKIKNRKTLSIILDGELEGRLRQDAERWNTSIAEIVRTALTDWYFRRDDKDSPTS